MIRKPVRSPRPVTPERATIRLEELCARAEHCEGELRQKLRLWKISGSDADAIIDSLRRRRYVDDSRFAAAFVRDKYRFNRWGRMKISMALRAKGVDADTAAEALEQIDADDYRSGLKALLQAKKKQLPQTLDPYDVKTRLFRFAAARGFEAAIITKVLGEL